MRVKDNFGDYHYPSHASLINGPLDGLVCSVKHLPPPQLITYAQLGRPKGMVERYYNENLEKQLTVIITRRPSYGRVAYVYGECGLHWHDSSIVVFAFRKALPIEDTGNGNEAVRLADGELCEFVLYTDSGEPYTGKVNPEEWGEV